MVRWYGTGQGFRGGAAIAGLAQRQQALDQQKMARVGQAIQQLGAARARQAEREREEAERQDVMNVLAGGEPTTEKGALARLGMEQTQKETEQKAQQIAISKGNLDARRMGMAADAAKAATDYRREEEDRRLAEEERERGEAERTDVLQAHRTMGGAIPTDVTKLMAGVSVPTMWQPKTVAGARERMSIMKQMGDMDIARRREARYGKEPSDAERRKALAEADIAELKRDAMRQAMESPEIKDKGIAATVVNRAIESIMETFPRKYDEMSGKYVYEQTPTPEQIAERTVRLLGGLPGGAPTVGGVDLTTVPVSAIRAELERRRAAK